MFVFTNLRKVYLCCALINLVMENSSFGFAVRYRSNAAIYSEDQPSMETSKADIFILVFITNFISYSRITLFLFIYVIFYFNYNLNNSIYQNFIISLI